jgi:multidrug efflux pump subunit AcrB
MGIVRFALKFPYTFYVLAAFIVLLGLSAIMVMPEDIFPEIDIPVVSVIWQYTGLSVPEMEQRVTTYSQYSINGVRKVLDLARKAAPPGLSIDELLDQSKLVTASIAGVLREGAIAAGLTGLMILLFLGSWRSTLIVLISIPLSILSSIVVLAGIKSGDQVILNPPVTLVDGSKVQPRAEAAAPGN